MPPQANESTSPPHLRPGAIRFARASRHYDMTIAFYRNLVALPVVGEFTASFGEDGTIFGLPDTRTQLEIVRAHEPAAFDQLVLYLDNAAAVDAATAPLRAAGCTADPDPHPYWAANGAVTYRDPDGREVVFAPWVYGRDPDPVDRPDARQETEAPVRVEWYDGDRVALKQGTGAAARLLHRRRPCPRRLARPGPGRAPPTRHDRRRNRRAEEHGGPR